MSSSKQVTPGNKLAFGNYQERSPGLYQTYNAAQRPDRQCKELIESLAAGMHSLQQFVAKDQNVDPNVQIIKVFDPVTQSWQLEHKVIGNNFETQSIKSDIQYKMSAIGEMNNEELTQLNVKNQKRMEKLEDAYRKEHEGMTEELTEKLRQQKEKFEIKEKQKEPSINFPTYGRGLRPPTIDLNTFMVNDKLCADRAQKDKRQAGGSGSPQANV